jgi:hypothetical protein
MIAAERRNERRHHAEMFRPCRGSLNICGNLPMAYAMGYRSFAAPRLVDTKLDPIHQNGGLIHIDATHDGTRSSIR